jgi:hypothetical protein
MESLSFDCTRRWGVELELNDMGGRPKGQMPKGTYYIANLVRKITDEQVLVHKWGHDHHNQAWVLKPDGSCGFEVCSPVSKGEHGIRRLTKVIDGIMGSEAQADNRCSVHIHVELSDLDIDQIASVVAWWVKCEAVFLDSVPPRRKKNRFCQFLGISNLFEHDVDYSSYNLIKKIGNCKYYTLNSFHLSEGKRCTMEFRILEERGVWDAEMTANWIRLVVHFVNCAAAKGMPSKYRRGDVWSGLLWLDPHDVFEFLGFRKSLSPTMEGVRDWFLDRLLENTMTVSENNIMGKEARKFAYSQTQSLAKEFGKEVPAASVYTHSKV